MKRFIKYGICTVMIVVSIVLLVNAVTVLVQRASHARYDICVMNENPRRVIDGLIAPTGIFNAGPVLYFMYYEGERKLSKQTCRYKVGVTKEEYERKIYGVEK